MNPDPLFTFLLALVMGVGFPMCLPYLIGKTLSDTPSFAANLAKDKFTNYHLTDKQLQMHHGIFKKAFFIRLVVATLICLSLAVTWVLLQIYSATHNLSHDQEMELGVIYGAVYILSSIIAFARLGSAKGQLELLKTASESDYDATLTSFIDSPDKFVLLDLVKSNPKQTITYLDILYWQAYAEHLENARKEQEKKEAGEKLEALKSKLATPNKLSAS